MQQYQRNSPSTMPDELLHRVRTLRTEATDAEKLMWRMLRNRTMAGAKFRRQHPVGNYIVDFYCDQYRLVIELDGGQHLEQQGYDERRTAYLEKQGITVLRFWNNQVLNETESVLQTIWEYVARK